MFNVDDQPCILSAQALQSYVQNCYNLGKDAKCVFLKRGLNDTYLITTETKRFILRVYTPGWRNLDEVISEIDLLKQLNTKAMPVAAPVPNKDNTYYQIIKTSDGIRIVVLFNYAQGVECKIINGDKCVQLGEAVAQIHICTDMFKSKLHRHVIDFSFLLDEPLRLLCNLLKFRLKDWHYLCEIAEQIKRQAPKLPCNSPIYGICHGDVHLGNVHFEHDNVLTFFDFDCCGYGWRVYDIATFQWMCHFAVPGTHEEKDFLCDEFLRGYNTVRVCEQIEIEALPYFIAARQIWTMAIIAKRVFIESDYISMDGFIDRELSVLREWVAL